ncbi:MAG: thioredoxin family protein [Candidatus Lokiarchaeota archaeon]|nr:thioredoxin family protein [Candidatus Lokiarchaeota archaeon]
MAVEKEAPDADVLLYTSAHCAPCTMLKRKLEAINTEMPVQIRIKTIDVGSNDEASKQGIRAVPVLKIVKNNELFVGDMEMDDLRNVLIRNLYFTS